VGEVGEAGGGVVVVLVLPSKVVDCGLGFQVGGGLGTEEYMGRGTKRLFPLLNHRSSNYEECSKRSSDRREGELKG
jgi:hypothetical protein